MTHNLEPGDIVMCTVERIAGATVFVAVDDNGTGSIALSEIAPGRIRNLRDYVVPRKRIICKVLRTQADHVDLSLRRVTPKEQKDLREQKKLEKSYHSLLQTVLKEKAKDTITKIQKTSSLYDFLEEAKENPKVLETFMTKKEAEQVVEILTTQKKRVVELKKTFTLHSEKPNGITLIKKILVPQKDITLHYLAAGKFLAKTQGTDVKKIDTLLTETLKTIQKEAKKLGLECTYS